MGIICTDFDRSNPQSTGIKAETLPLDHQAFSLIILLLSQQYLLKVQCVRYFEGVHKENRQHILCQVKMVVQECRQQQERLLFMSILIYVCVGIQDLF